MAPDWQIGDLVHELRGLTEEVAIGEDAAR